MTTGPTVIPVARPALAPLAESVALPVLELQMVVGLFVLSMLVPSLNISSAVYCRVPETGIEADAGESFNPVGVAAFTVNTAVADGPPTPKVAVMVDAPTAAPVARPAVAPLGERVALAVLELQMVVGLVVLSMLVPSLNISNAVYCRVPETGIEADVGVSNNAFGVAELTVKEAVPDTPP